MRKNSNFCRWIASIVVTAFLFSATVPPFIQASLWQERKQAVSAIAQNREKSKKVFEQLKNARSSSSQTLALSNFQTSSFGIEIPQELGTVVESWEGAESPRHGGQAHSTVPATAGRHRPQSEEQSSKLSTNSQLPASPAGGSTLNSKLPLVIHIQDAHGHYAAQKNAAAILKLLANNGAVKSPWSIDHSKQQADDVASNYGLSTMDYGRPASPHLPASPAGGPLSVSYRSPLLVFVEGAWGEIRTDELGLFPVTDARDEMAEIFLKQEKISAEEYISILYPERLEIKGIENEKIYKLNLASRKIMSAERKSVLSRIENLEERLQKIKNKIYSPPHFPRFFFLSLREARNKAKTNRSKLQPPHPTTEPNAP